ncbi:hypothetical protein PPL_10865 [Heterostelium album PN500]|uniref:F-box domain-containing protein n=1 Tax=Heterostelium pallidum (strain ATCC 26659 / Pp 5 / PN500) TaxID=670386 RepID=D3BS73_HETP5|nr:hypothetical protein PPL_10865 [Heterostelium album PN500]EFA75810.1 hypothetical protein PPL_10865 [Heterostelium album PN500]|eukprot:XP_020427944.1 hypothetical protein PPL_10865 [Heterostelium album PN500]
MNNQTDKIVNLSHLILNKIISYIDDNIDIICFSLVCKRWYNDRDKYLVFNTDNINLFTPKNTDIIQYHKHFKLPSYYNILLKSIQSKTNCALYVGDYHFKNYDYFYDHVEMVISIPSNVSEIYITTNYSKDKLGKFYRLLSESQSVTKLNGCSTLKYGLPNSLQTLSFRNFNEPLVKGSLPNSLEVLDFDSNLRQEILPGVLPGRLLKLSLEYYQYEIQPGVLPDSLLSFTLDHHQHEIQPNILPAGLLSFFLDDYQHEILPYVLPSSLKLLSLKCYRDTLKEDLRYVYATTGDDNVIMKSCLPLSWLQSISSLSNLQSLDIYFSISNQEDTTMFNLNYLPPNLESLEITINAPGIILCGTTPLSLKRIQLNGCQFKIDEIFPETLQYHLEIFDYENDSILPIPSNIKIDTLFISGEPSESTITLPSGISTIFFFSELSSSGEKMIDFGGDGVTDQTCPLKELRFPAFKDGYPKVKLPKTIEHLDIGDNNLNDILHLIPSTLNTLVFSKLSNIDITIIPSTIKSITNIIRKFGLFNKQTIRKLDDNYYLITDDYEYEHSFKVVFRNAIDKYFISNMRNFNK